MRLRLFLALAPLALAACGKEASTDDGRAAQGEVLKGSISDEMLPVDTVRSEPPLEDPEAAEAAREGGGGPAAESTDAPAQADEPGDEAPAAEPTPEAED